MLIIHNSKERNMKTTILFIAVAISLLAIPFILSEPSFNGNNPGCAGSGCHTFSDGIISVTALNSLQVEVLLSGTTSKVAGELVDGSGNVVDVINSTSSNPFILTAPSEGTFTVNAGYKNPSRLWDSSMVVLTSILPPDAPTNLSANIISNTQIDISWTDNANNEDGFKIERKTGQTGTWSEIAQVAANTTSFSNTGLTASTEYCYRVRAFNSAGNSAYSNEVCATTNPDIPNAPSNLTAIVHQNPISVELNWTDNSNNEEGFVIERDTPVLDFIVVDTVLQNVTSYVDTSMAITTNIYRVKAFNITGDSPYSDTAQVFVPVELTSFTATVNENGVMLEWITATEINNMGFEVQRKTNNVWQTLDFVDGNGTTTEISYYNFTDDLEGISFVGTISYRLKQIDYDGTFEYSDIVNVDVDFTPDEYSLSQNYPNPFNPSTTIKYSLPAESNVLLSVYNLIGEKVDELSNGIQQAGTYNINWNVSDFASGIYYYRLDVNSLSGDFSKSFVKKMILVK
jgi:Fibronectin type III domain/Secretion system C-terminal sorting domain